MKTKITLLVLFMTFIGFAQNGINYKALIKDDFGNLVANQSVNIRFTILEGASNVYQETHLPMTDANGIAIVNIGEGTVVSGTFSTIDWTSDDYFLKVEIDSTGGTTFVLMGTTQFKSVPYAITAGAIELPYFSSTTQSSPAFHVHNDGIISRYGLAGSVGTNGETLPANNAGVMGNGVEAHGVYGVSKTSFFAGVQGVSESPTGVGVQGYGFGGGVGGHFYTTSTGTAALTTGRGNVGIGISEPEMKLHMGGDLFIQTNLGELVMGFPNNGNQWQMGTRAQGADLQFQAKPTGTNSFITKFRMRQDGEFQVGDIGTPEAWMHIQNNSTSDKTHLLLEEVGNDYARIGFENTSVTNADWQMAVLPSNNSAIARVNFYYRNTDGAANKMTLLGNGKLGIDGTPTSKLHIFQKSQAVGSGLAFSDNSANADWNITHGYALNFHYGSTLKSYILATTGAYVQASDKILKSNINDFGTVLSKVNKLKPSTYNYRDDLSNKKSIGFIAQDVKSIFPEVVHFSEIDGLYGIDYTAFGVIAIKAIQEQQTLIVNQQKQIDELKSMMQTLINKQ